MPRLDSFLTNDIIVLQPGSSSVPYSYTFSPASSATANDGSIPYDSTITSAAVKVFDSDNVDVTTEILVSSSTTTTKVSVALKYPAISGNGEYQLEILATLNTGAVMEFDFARIVARDTAM